MRVLCAALASDGFLLPTIAVARELERRGHEAAFVTDRSCAERLARCGFERIPRGRGDGPSFGVSCWFDPVAVAVQYAHLRAAAKCFRPDVILASHLALGPVAFCAAQRIPLAVIGPIVYLWPLCDDAAYPDSGRARAAAWRWSELRNTYHRACRELQLAPNDAAILGDRYLLQSVPAFDPLIAALLPPHVRHVGSCLLTQPGADTRDTESWIDAQRKWGRTVAFVQLGRTFGKADPWPAIAGWAAADGIALVASLERYERAVESAAGQVLMRDGIALERVVPLVDLVICSGTPSPLLAAAAAGKPALIACGGSGTEEHADAFQRYGSASAFDAANADRQRIAELARHMLHEPAFTQRAQSLAAAFAGCDGPALAADEVEATAAVAV